MVLEADAAVAVVVIVTVCASALLAEVAMMDGN